MAVCLLFMHILMTWNGVRAVSVGNVLIYTTVILPCDLEENFVVQLSV